MANQAAVATAKKIRLRGAILELVYANQEAQQSRLSHVVLYGVLESLGHDVSRNDVITTLQDLKERTYIWCKEEKDVDSGKVSINQIQITPNGRDVVDKIKVDPAVGIA